MSVKYPYGEADIQLISPTGGTVEIEITDQETIIETLTLTNNVTLNLTVHNQVEAGAMVFVLCTTDAAETFAFGSNIDAPTVTGQAGKVWSQAFFYNGSKFYPASEYVFVDHPHATVTIGSMNFAGGAQPTVGASIVGGALISGGAAPYTLGTITGDEVTGLTASFAENAGSWYFVLTGIPTTFGSYTFTVTGTDDNGCAITPKEYTIDVWQVFENSTPVDADQIMLVTVSGLPATIGTGVRIESIEYSTTLGDNSGVGLFLDDTLLGNQLLFFNEGDLSGADFTNTKFLRGNSTNIISGTAPYTGSFSPTNNDPSGFDTFNGSVTNGDWQFYFTYSIAPVGSWVYARITFKPI